MTDLIQRTVTRALLDARRDEALTYWVDRGDGLEEVPTSVGRVAYRGLIDRLGRVCCPNHGQCPLGCWAEADEED